MEDGLAEVIDANGLGDSDRDDWDFSDNDGAADKNVDESEADSDSESDDESMPEGPGKPRAKELAAARQAEIMVCALCACHSDKDDNNKTLCGGSPPARVLLDDS